MKEAIQQTLFLMIKFSSLPRDFLDDDQIDFSQKIFISSIFLELTFCQKNLSKVLIHHQEITVINMHSK